MAETLRQLGLDRTRARKGAVRPELTPSQIRGLLADVATGGGVPFIDAASQAAQGNYGQAAISGLLDAPPVKMAGMALAPLIGMVRKAAPMDEALRIAQKNAAKPVSKGGLGLPKNNTPMDRARAMGFDEGWYHGTFNDVPYFDISKVKENYPYSIGVHLTNRPSEANIYSNKANFDSKEIVEGANVMPLMLREGNALKKETKQSTASMEADLNRYQIIKELLNARESGNPYDSVIISRNRGDDFDGKNFITRNPSLIRSRFAAFDPARINENNLLASLAALGISIPVMRGLLQEEEMQ